MIALAALLIAATGPDAPVQTVRDDGVVDGAIRGKPARIRIDPGGATMPMLTADYAARIGLKRGMFSVRVAVGPVAVTGATAVTDLIVDGAAFKRRVVWFERPYAAGVDAVVGPGSLPAPVIRFVLHAPRPGEHSLALPMAGAGGLAGNWSGLFAAIPVGAEPLLVRFDPHHRHSLASAGAGLRLAAAFGGQFDGPAESAEIMFGIERPVRRMKLARPVTLGPLSIDAIHVRIADFGNAASIPEAGTQPDPDEVVVTAKGKRDTRRDRLSIGMDQLERCSSIVFDKPAKQIILTCA